MATDSQAPSEYPLYNIGVVTRMTGISIATLRAWERRYGFPSSGRTGGGHRLYSERDVLCLRWVKQQIDQGMQTAQAIQALAIEERSGRASLVQAFPGAGARPAEPPASATSYRAQLLQVLVRHDTVGADQILGEALPIMQPEGLILDVIGPTLAAIGDAWANSEVSVATEHLATNYLRQKLLMWMMSGPPPYGVNPVILGCAPGELHEGGLLMLGALLRRRGWPVAYLGQSVPLADLAALVRDLAPPLIVLVATTEETAVALVEWPQALPPSTRSGRQPFAFAGRVFDQHPEWRERVSGLFLGVSVREGLEMVESRLAPLRR